MNQAKFVGVDAHKDTIACFVEGKFREFKTDSKGFKKALEWAGKDAKWVIEGAYSYGLYFSKFLLESGCEVFEINALTTSRLRKIDSVANNKNDYGDAKVISLFAHQTKLQKVSLQTVKLKEKLTTRELLVKQRTQLINTLRAMSVRDRSIELPKNLTTQKAINALNNSNNQVVCALGKVIKELNETMSLLEKEIAQLIPEKVKDLTTLKGIGILSAAAIYAETKGKKMTKAQLASYCGIAPVENSSGKSHKNRNNKRGNRKLNSIFYRTSLHQSRFDEKGNAYFEKKLSEGKTKRHARKCLSRQLVNLVWNILFND